MNGPLVEPPRDPWFAKPWHEHELVREHFPEWKSETYGHRHDDGETEHEHRPGLGKVVKR